MSYKKNISIEDLYKLKFVSDPQISPDGKRIVFVVASAQKFEGGKEGYVSKLWMADLETNEVYQFTFGRGVDSNPRWSKDGRYILFLSNRDDEKRGPQVYIIPSFGGEAKRLTNFKHGVRNPQWSPRGNKILFIASPEEDERRKEYDVKTINRLFYKLDGQGIFPPNRFHLFYTTVTGSREKQVTSGNFDVEDAAWSPDGKYIAFVSNIEKDQDYTYERNIYLTSWKGGKIKKLTGVKSYIQGLSWSPDGTKLAFIASTLKKGFASNWGVWLYTMGERKPVYLTEDIDISVGNAVNSDARFAESAPGIVWSPDGKKLYFLTTDGPNTYVMELDIETRELRRVIYGDRVIDNFTLDSSGKTFAFAAMDPITPKEVYIAEGDWEKKVTSFNDDLVDEMLLVDPERFTFKASDGKEIEGWIMKPPDFDASKKYPVIFEIHGGPRTAYGNAFMHEFQVLAAKGFVIAYINPRGSAGYGEDFAFEIVKKYGERDYQDIMEAVEYIEKLPYVDPEKIGVTGGSYGGYMTNWIVTHTDRFKAAVTQRSISNFISFFGTSDVGYLFTTEEIGGTPWRKYRKYIEKSPLFHVNYVKTPILIIHSENDLRCPIGQAEEFYTALKYLKKEVEFVRYPGETHELSRSGRPDHRVDRLERIAKWFEKYLK